MTSTRAGGGATPIPMLRLTSARTLAAAMANATQNPRLKQNMRRQMRDFRSMTSNPQISPTGYLNARFGKRLRVMSVSLWDRGPGNDANRFILVWRNGGIGGRRC